MLKTFDTVEEFWTWDLIEQISLEASDHSIQEFRKEFASFVGVETEKVHFTPSGHQALEQLLRSKSNSGKNVMIPAFNCGVVQDAIHAVGLKSKYYDFSSQSADFNWENIMREMCSEVGVIIITHFFGVPINFEPILEYCKRRNILVIEDCAHSLGGMINDQQVGTIGDASFFSFNYDKPISLGWGGVAVVNNKNGFHDFQNYVFRTPKVVEEFDLFYEFNKYLVKRRKMIPFETKLTTKILRKLRLFRTNLFRKDKNISLGAIQAELGRWCFLEYPRIVKQRNSNAYKLADSINSKIWGIGENVKAVWLKQKVSILDESFRVDVSNLLQRNGVRVGNFNWPNLLHGVDAQKYPISATFASSWLDVPIHQNLTENILNEVISVLNK